MTADMPADPQVPPAAPVALELVPEGGHFSGLLHFRGEARVEGDLDGEIWAEGRLVIGPGARVRARVEVDELVVAGDLAGEIQAHTRAELLPTARVQGELVTARLVLREGARLEGRCRTASAAPRNDLLP